MKIILKDKLSASNILDIRRIYEQSFKLLPTTISGPDDADPSSKYVLVMEGRNVVAYAEVSELSDLGIGIARVFVSPKHRGKGYFKAMDEFINDNFPEYDVIYYATDEKDPAALHLKRDYFTDTLSRELLLVKYASRHLSTDISLEIAEIDSTFTSNYRDIFFPDEDIDVVENLLADICGDENNGITYNITKDKRVVGLFMLSFYNDIAFISSFGILPAFRRQHFGLLALKAIINYSLDNHVKKMTVQVSGNNKPALKLYKKAGFIETGKLAYICFWD